MKKIVLSILALAFAISLQAQEAASDANQEKAEIEWLTWTEAAEKMEAEPRKLMVDVYTDWCGWCKRMDATTMKNPHIVQTVNEHYYAIKLDGEHKSDIEFKGKVYKFVAQGRRGYHELPATIMNGKMSYPTLVFLDENFQIIQPLPGYQRPQQLDPILNYFAGDFYKSVKWEKFQSEYKSPLNP